MRVFDVLPIDAYPPLLASLQADFLAAARVVDPNSAVPACGDWTVADLVEHLAGIHHWAAAMARGVRTQPLEPPVDVAAYDAAAAELCDTLAELGPDATGRILNGLTPDGRGPVSFWARRQVHETLIHLDDLRSAAGAPAVEQPPEVWADTVDEVVTIMYARQVAVGRTSPVAPAIVLVAGDADATFQLGAGEAVAAVRGGARDLALLLWKRRSLAAAGVVVTGDPAAVDAALALPLVP